MKKFLMCLLLLAGSMAFGQIKATDAATVSTSGKIFTHINVIGEIQAQVEYVITGSPGTVSIILQGCMRGGTCSTINTYGVVANTLVPLNGLYDYFTVTPSWTGGSSPTVTINWLGSTRASSGGGGSGTVSACAGAGNAFYNGAGSTVNCDTAIVDTSGTLNFTQGNISASAPWLNHTATWTTGGVVYVAISSNVTCTAASAASKLFDFQVGAASQFNLTFAAINCAGPRVGIPDGSVTQASFGFSSEATGAGWFKQAANDWCLTTSALCYFRATTGRGITLPSAGAYGWAASTNAATAYDTCVDRQGAGVVRADANTACNDGLGKFQAQLYTTTTNCASSAGTCGAASSGAVTIAAAATTVTVATTAVTANSQIDVSEDSSLGTRLSVTCNTTISRTYAITARTAATSFVITTSAAPTTNPACLNYTIIN